MAEEAGPGDGFRAFDQITQRDRRRRNWIVQDATTGELRRYGLEDLHDELDALGLETYVPVAVRVQFDHARNLLLYSYFVYRFVQMAELQALRTLEFALREAFEIAERKPPTLRSLVERAIHEGRIDAAELGSRVRARWGESCRAGISDVAGRFETETGEAAAELEALAEGLGWYRNTLAHGGRHLAPGGFYALDICRTLIHQAFGGRGAMSPTREYAESHGPS